MCKFYRSMRRHNASFNVSSICDINIAILYNCVYLRLTKSSFPVIMIYFLWPYVQNKRIIKLKSHEIVLNLLKSFDIFVNDSINLFEKILIYVWAWWKIDPLILMINWRRVIWEMNLWMVKRKIEEMACIISSWNHRLEYNYFSFLKFLCPLYKTSISYRLHKSSFKNTRSDDA